MPTSSWSIVAHRPGGHWNDAYPFVRLHQPAAFYGVNSRSWARTRSRPPVRTPVLRAVERGRDLRLLLPRARRDAPADGALPLLRQDRAPWRDRWGAPVRLLPAPVARRPCRCVGQWSTPRTRRPRSPTTHAPSFRVAPAACCIPVNDLVSIDEPPAGFVRARRREDRHGRGCLAAAPRHRSGHHLMDPSA